MEEENANLVMSKIKALEIENNKSFSRKRKQENLKNWITILMIGLANILYLFSLEYCKESIESKCWELIFPKITQLLLMCLISSLLFSLSCIFTIYYNLNKMFIVFAIINEYLLWSYDDGQTLQSHGGYNRVLLLIATIFFIIVIIILLSLAKLYSLLNSGVKYLIIFSLITYSYYFHKYTILTSCDNWYLGLKGSQMDNSINCKITKPNICWLEITNRIFDLSRIFNYDCDYKYNQFEELFYKDMKLIAFPDTRLYSREQRSYKNIQNLIFSDLKEVSEITEHEIVLNRTDKYNPEFIINIKENATVKERVKTRREGDNYRGVDVPITDNVMFIFLDTISRTQFRRKLPKVYRWIEQFYNNKTSPVEAFQFFKYQGAMPNTRLTLTPILTGTHPILKERINYFIQKYFKDFGFVTAQTMNICNSLNINYEPDDDKSFIWENFDHEMFTPFCDPNYWIPGKEYGLFNGPYSSLRRCIYGKDSFEYMFEFSSQFLSLYPGERKYLEMYFLDGHELTNEVITYLDKRLYEWLKLHEELFFSTNTSLIFITDHGLHMNGFSGALNLEDIIKELVLPNLMVLLPRQLADSSYGISMKENENKMIGSYDIHSLLQELSGARNFSIYGTSPTRNIGDRMCADLHVSSKSCRCFYN